MATIIRRLVPVKKDGKVQLYFIVKNGRSDRWEIPSMIKLPSKCWTSGKKVKNIYPDYTLLNSVLDKSESRLSVTLSEMLEKNSNSAHADILKGLTDSLSGMNPATIRLLEEKENKQTFFEFTSTFVRNARATKTASTIRSYIQTINCLKDFNPNLDFEDFTIDFYFDFMYYLTSDRGVNDNTAGKHVKVLKTILNEATERNLNSTFEYRKKKFKVLREEVDTVYLSQDEIQSLYNIRPELTEAKRKVCDLFLIGCHTGLRYSDFSTLSRDNIFADDTGTYVLLRTRKTFQQVVIPLNSQAQMILASYNGEFPESISNQKTNQALKEICRKAGISKMIVSKVKRGARVETETLPKYEMVCTHTARRSFSTNAFLAGVPVLSIMKITGHKTEKSFMQYIKVTQLENAMLLSKHPFFK